MLRRNWKKVRLVMLCAALACLSAVVPALADADCSADNTCAYVPLHTSKQVTPTFSGAAPVCALISNDSCAGDLMVPTKNQDEWNSFINSDLVKSACVTVGNCAVSKGTCGTWDGYDGEVNTHNGCITSVPHSIYTYCAGGTQSTISCSTGHSGAVSACSCSWTCSGNGTTASCSAKSTTDN